MTAMMQCNAIVAMFSLAMTVATTTAAQAGTSSPSDLRQPLLQMDQQLGTVGSSLWLDAPTLQYFLSSLNTFKGGELAPVLADLEGARLERHESGLFVTVIFHDQKTVMLGDPSTTPDWQVDAIELPRILEFTIASPSSGVFELEGLIGASGADGLLADQNTFLIDLKLPSAVSLLPNQVYLKGATVDLEAETATVTAGVLDNTVTLVANAKLSSGKLSVGFDFLSSIADNLELLSLPAAALVFSIQ